MVSLRKKLIVARVSSFAASIQSTQGGYKS